MPRDHQGQAVEPTKSSMRSSCRVGSGTRPGSRLLAGRRGRVPGAAWVLLIDAADAVTEWLDTGPPQPQRAARVSSRAPSEVSRCRSPRTSSGPAGSRVIGRAGRFLRIAGPKPVVEGTGGAAADDLGHGLGVGQVGADPGPAGWVEQLRQPADAFGVVAAAARS